MKKEFNLEEIKAFEPEAKIGLLATINDVGLPHISLITSIRAKSAEKMMWGQFSRGFSKINVRNNPNTAFYIMTMDRKLWRGSAKWTGSIDEGDDFETFNNQPMFRYNAYFGIHTVHYMDLIETTEKESLPLLKIIASSLLTKISKKAVSKTSDKKIMNSWTQKLFNRLDALKFLSYINESGYPVIIPLLQIQAADSSRLAFNPGTYKSELMKIKAGTDVAVFGLTLDMEDVLVRGTFKGYSRPRGIQLGSIDINWIYNSMPPIPGQIYPETKLQAVTDF